MNKIISIIIILVLVSSIGSFAASFDKITIQGKLVDSSGNPVSERHTFKAALLKSPTETVPVFTETFTDVDITGGVFNLMLGSSATIPEKFFIDNPDAQLQLYIDNEKFNSVVPITSSGYAFYARNAIDTSSQPQEKQGPLTINNYLSVGGDSNVNNVNSDGTITIDATGKTPVYPVFVLKTNSGQILNILTADGNFTANYGNILNNLTIGNGICTSAGSCVSVSNLIDAYKNPIWSRLNNNIFYLAGNVGIFTNNPQSRLTVSGYGLNPAAPLFSIFTNTGNLVTIVDASGNLYGGKLCRTGGGCIDISNLVSNQGYWFNNGINNLYTSYKYVGIGTATPDINYKLHVNGGIKATNINVTDVNTTNLYAVNIFGNVDNANKLGGQLPGYYLDTSLNTQTKTGGLNTKGKLGVGTENINQYNSFNNIVVSGSDAGITLHTGTAKSQINFKRGTDYLNSVASIIYDGSQGDRLTFYLKNNPKVVIPSGQLILGDPNNNIGSASLEVNGGARFFGSSPSNPRPGTMLYNENIDKYIYFSRSGQWVPFGGDVSSSQVPAGDSLWKLSGTNIYYSSGNVGVGTISPTEALDVIGDIKSSGTVCDGSGKCIGDVKSDQFCNNAGTSCMSYIDILNSVSNDLTVPRLSIVNVAAIWNSKQTTNFEIARALKAQGCTGALYYFSGSTWYTIAAVQTEPYSGSAVTVSKGGYLMLKLGSCASYTLPIHPVNLPGYSLGDVVTSSLKVQDFATVTNGLTVGGKVGIGITAPDYPLVIGAASGAKALVFKPTSGEFVSIGHQSPTSTDTNTNINLYHDKVEVVNQLSVTKRSATEGGDLSVDKNIYAGGFVRVGGINTVVEDISSTCPAYGALFLCTRNSKSGTGGYPCPVYNWANCASKLSPYDDVLMVCVEKYDGTSYRMQWYGINC